MSDQNFGLNDAGGADGGASAAVGAGAEAAGQLGGSAGTSAGASSQYDPGGSSGSPQVSDTGPSGPGNATSFNSPGPMSICHNAGDMLSPDSGSSHNQATDYGEFNATLSEWETYQRTHPVH
jgi:hypothetical protein